ncbi:hypothetical protein C4D60_Mb06t32910 [Musa balbisiana]|uniref:Uncharacterized protein n=1 Tax=Musa balbisiana TaxID=52838 RepID=A0A4S8ISD4_MUSBA|nr:hypothetical protein C4D60_Mb06t32910 [Musa balbisiana]
MENAGILFAVMLDNKVSPFSVFLLLLFLFPMCRPCPFSFSLLLEFCFRVVRLEKRSKVELNQESRKGLTTATPIIGTPTDKEEVVKLPLLLDYRKLVETRREMYPMQACEESQVEKWNEMDSTPKRLAQNIHPSATTAYTNPTLHTSKS